MLKIRFFGLSRLMAVFIGVLVFLNRLLITLMRGLLTFHLMSTRILLLF